MKKDNILTLEEWYFNKNTSIRNLTNEQFYELLDCLDFELQSEELKNMVKIYSLKDLQNANLADIEQDIFYVPWSEKESDEEDFICIKEQIVNRLETYLYDYFERDN